MSQVDLVLDGFGNAQARPLRIEREVYMQYTYLIIYPSVPSNGKQGINEYIDKS